MAGFCETEFQQLYERGYIREDIAERLNISQTTINKYIKKLGLTPRGYGHITKRFWTPQRDEKLKQMWLDEIRAKDIGKHFGKSIHSICARASALGLERRDHHKKSSWTDERVKILKQLWSEGWSSSQIADELGGVTRNAVVGKISRLRLADIRSEHSKGPRKRRKPRKSPPVKDGREQVVKVFQPKPKDVLPLPPDKAEFTKEFSELEADMCRNISGTGPYKYCGRPTGGETYCPSCYQRNHQKAKRYA